MSLKAVAFDNLETTGPSPLDVAAPLSLQVVKGGNLSPALRREICAFLDSQHTAHPFQFPQWSQDKTQHALIRCQGRLGWYANWGIQQPTTALGMVRSVMVNRGPVCDDATFWRASLGLFQNDLKRQGFAYVDIAPDRLVCEEGNPELAASGWQHRGQLRTSLRLDLTADSDRIFAAFRKSTRYEIRRAERAGIRVGEPENEDQAEQFLDLYCRMSERKGFSAESREHMRDVLGWLETEKSRGALLLAQHAGKLAGGVIVVRAGQRCWYVWGATDRHLEVNAGHILQWHALLWAKSLRCTQYDFGGYTVGATSGPAWFKQGFGGEVVHFPGAYRCVLHGLRYGLLRCVSRT
jgi:hypothetical protein